MNETVIIPRRGVPSRGFSHTHENLSSTSSLFFRQLSLRLIVPDDYQSKRMRVRCPIACETAFTIIIVNRRRKNTHSSIQRPLINARRDRFPGKNFADRIIDNSTIILPTFTRILNSSRSFSSSGFLFYEKKG